MADKLTIVCNGQWRNMLYGYELTAEERKEFDYIPADDFDSHDFVRYLGVVYDVHEFETTSTILDNDHPFRKWDGKKSDSYFSGVLIKMNQDNDRCMMARFYC